MKKSVERMIRFCQKRSCERVHPLRGGESGEAITALVNPPDVRVTKFFWPLKRELGFGAYAPALVKLESVDKLPPDVAVGMQFEAYANPGEEQGGGVVFTVTDVADGKAVLDGNHPWAGKRLRFECQVVDVRPATAEELEHGHVHGPGSHHHH